MRALKEGSQTTRREIFEETAAHVHKRYAQYVNHRFARVLELIGFKQVFTRAQGAWLWDQAGAKYLDFLGGYSVFNVGRNHPLVKRALIDWLEQDGASLVQMECGPLAARLAEKVAALAPGDLNTSFFTNSGAETAEVALKIARKATRRPRILYAESGYHGLTYGALSVTDDRTWRDGFEPLHLGRGTWRPSSPSRSRERRASESRRTTTSGRR